MTVRASIVAWTAAAFVCGAMLVVHARVVPAVDAYAGVDFYDYYFAARAWRAGASPYDSAANQGLARDARVPSIAGSDYLYPPWFAVALGPLTVLPPRAAFALWTLASLLALGLALHHLRARRLPWMTAAVLLMPPTLFSLAVGQVNHLLLALLACAWAFRARKPGLAGALIGVAGAIKLAPLLVLLACPRRHRMAAARGAAGAFAVALIGGEVLAPGELRRWAFEALPRATVFSADRAHPVNQGVQALLARTFVSNAWTSPLVVLPTHVVGVVAALVAVLVVALVGFRALSLVARGRGETWRAWASLVTVSVLASPLAWEGTFALLAMPILLAARRVDARLLGGSVALFVLQRALDGFAHAPGAFPLLQRIPIVTSLGLVSGCVLLAAIMARSKGGSTCS
jgi:hypothetical protein